MNRTHSARITVSRKFAILVPAIFFALCAVANIVLTASVSNVGSEIHVISMKTKALKTANAEIEVDLATARSLAKTKSDADILGFAPVKSLTTIDSAGTRLAQSVQ